LLLLHLEVRPVRIEARLVVASFVLAFTHTVSSFHFYRVSILGDTNVGFMNGATDQATDAEGTGLTEPPVENANGSSTKEEKVMIEDEDEMLDDGKDNFVDVPAVGWGRQLWVALWYKNLPLFQRKPFHVIILILSGVASVLTAWPAGRDFTSDEAIYPPELTDCGTIPLDYFGNITGDFGYYEYGGNDGNDDSKVKVSLNENWRRGLPVAVMSLGPMLSAIVAYLIVHEELQLHMLGVLRGLGMPDSVYWASWYIPFASLALVNSLLAAVTAKLLPVHVFEATYLGGIFGAFFFLHLALLGASFFLAAVSGTAKRGAVWLILLMLIPLWMPYFVMNSNYFGFTAKDLAVGDSYSLGTHHGLFWLNRETQSRNMIYPDYSGYYNDDFIFNASNPNETYPPRPQFNFSVTQEETCNAPLLSKTESFRFKTDSMRSEVTPDQFFVGCYFSPGFSSGAWSPRKKTNAGLAVWWFIPYFHFNVIWGNICGYTGNRNAEFRSEHATMTAAQLAREGLPAPPNEKNGRGTTLFQQGSMLRTADVNKYVCAVPEQAFGYCEKFLSNCPAQNLSNDDFNFCSESDDQYGGYCAYAEPVEGVSLNATFAMLAALSLVYVLLAAFWGIVFVGGAGTYPFYFMCIPSYWVGSNRSQRGNRNGGNGSDVEVGPGGDTTSRGAAVRVNAVSKSYGSVQALQPVSFEMARGEVTALLGHNGAGKTSKWFSLQYKSGSSIQCLMISS
jgi:hypothetical protein